MLSIGRLALLFIAVPLMELFILIRLGQFLGVWPTLGLVVATGLAGAALARLEGLRTLLKIRGELARGRLPGQAMLDGFGILVGGVLLLTPGILTDLLGLAFLLPATRKLLLGRIRRSLERRLRAGSIQIFRADGFPAGFGRGSPSPADLRSGSQEDPRGGPGEIVVEPEHRSGEG